MYRDYKDQVDFYYLYSHVQHPGINGIVPAATLKEKQMHVAEAKRRTQSEIPFICDTMEHKIKHALGNAPNGEVILDPDGKIVVKRFWSIPNTLREDLAKLVGKSKTTTTVDQLPARFAPEKREVASGVVPPIKLPKRLKPLLTTSVIENEEDPIYVKLRAEAQMSNAGPNGKFFLAFYVDPLYKVHWNNRGPKFTVQITPPEGVEISKGELEGPEVKEDADIDPRMFLVDISSTSAALASKASIKVTVNFMVCDDAETFCVPVTQQFDVALKANRDGGTRPGVFLHTMFAKVMEMDKNGDGDLTADELPPGRVGLYIGHMDKNNNDKIEAVEIKEFMEMFNNGDGLKSGLPDGGDSMFIPMMHK